jgi:hypothetical protein
MYTIIMFVVRLYGDEALDNALNMFVKLLLSIPQSDLLVSNRLRFTHLPTSKIHTYHSRFIPEGVAEVSQIFLRDTHVLPKLVSYEEHRRCDRW